MFDTFKIGNKNLSKIEANTIIKAITIYGQFQGSSIGLRLSQIALNSIVLTPVQGPSRHKAQRAAG